VCSVRIEGDGPLKPCRKDAMGCEVLHRNVVAKDDLMEATVNETAINDFEINQYLKEGAMSHLNTINIIRIWKGSEYRKDLYNKVETLPRV
jgi:hypothetical protein